MSEELNKLIERMKNQFESLYFKQKQHLFFTKHDESSQRFDRYSEDMLLRIESIMSNFEKLEKEIEKGK